MSHDLLYKKLLRRVQKSLGTAATTTAQLEQTGKKLLGSKFAGVYASNKIPKSFTSVIVNLDKEGEPGSHWLAMARCSSGTVLVYDSFGRPTAKIIKLNFPNKATDPDREQMFKETNCGQRSLAWLLFFFLYGEGLAQLI